jgi:hypothetical protein
MMQVMRDIGGVEFPEKFASLADVDVAKAEKKPSGDGHTDPQPA